MEPNGDAPGVAFRDPPARLMPAAPPTAPGSAGAGRPQRAHTTTPDKHAAAAVFQGGGMGGGRPPVMPALQTTPRFQNSRPQSASVTELEPKIGTTTPPSSSCD